MNLCQRQVVMLEMNFFRTPAMCEFVEDNLDDLHVRIINLGNSLPIRVNVCRWRL
jgi:hypothetical protein